jgi:hypothetical protein
VARETIIPIFIKFHVHRVYHITELLILGGRATVINISRVEKSCSEVKFLQLSIAWTVTNTSVAEYILTGKSL